MSRTMRKPSPLVFETLVALCLPRIGTSPLNSLRGEFSREIRIRTAPSHVGQRATRLGNRGLLHVLNRHPEFQPPPKRTGKEQGNRR